MSSDAERAEAEGACQTPEDVGYGWGLVLRCRRFERSTDTPPRGFLNCPARARCDLGRSEPEPAKRLRLNYVNQLKGQA